VLGLSLVHRYLAPDETLAEVLFGLIMALTITVGARLFGEGGQFDPHRLVLATIGCNVAWGIIDAVLFVLGGLFNGSRRARFHRALLSARNESDALAALAEEFDLEDEPLEFRAEDRARLYEALLSLSAHAKLANPHLHRRDVFGALFIVVLVSAAALPGAVPLLLFNDPGLGLHVSNWMLIALLLFVGHRWGRYTDVRPWRAGLIVMLLGVCMVLIALILGG